MSATASRPAWPAPKKANTAQGPRPKRPLIADPVYQSPLVTQLVNKVLVDGKRSVAEAIVYGALEGARAKRHRPGRHAQARAGQRQAGLEVRSRRVGGATYQVPVEVRASRGTTLGLRWLIQYGAPAARRR